MKVYIDNNSTREGYKNIATIDPGKDTKHILGKINNLDWLCENNAIQELICNNMLHHIRQEELKETIQNWCQKLTNGAELKINDRDIFVLSKIFVQGKISTEKFGQILLNNGNTKSVSDMQLIEELLINAGFKIINKKYDGVELCIKAKKD